MRKAGKKRIEQALAELREWQSSMSQRVAALPADAQRLIREWETDLESRITEGDIGPCTQALAKSIGRVVRDFETGFYLGVSPDGTFTCA